MRCARCDRIAVPQALGRLPDGRLVFGWCHACLIDSDCAPVAAEGIEFLLRRDRPRLRRRLARLGRSIRMARAGGRRLAALGIATLMAAWALILTFIGGLRPPGSPWLFAGGGLMALVSLAIFWAALIGRAQRARVAWRVVQVAATTVAFGTLIWGVIDHAPRRDPALILVVAAALAVFWAARRFERRRRGPKRPSTIGAL